MSLQQQRPDGTWGPAEPWRVLGLFPYLLARARGERKVVFARLIFGWRYALFGVDARRWPKDEAP